MLKQEIDKIKYIMQPYFSLKYFDRYPTFEKKFEEVLKVLKALSSSTNDLIANINFDDPDLIQFITEMLHVNQAPEFVFQSKGYVPWLNDQKSSIKWNFWDRYEKYLLTKKNWSWDSINDIDRSTDTILDHLANPKNDKGFRIRGLVLGDIQSGKTANYTGLINKAVDAGYKMIIVLAGLTNDLRYQTQIRLDKEFIGKLTKDNQEAGSPIGVGTIDAPTGKFRVQSFTYADETNSTGDFKKMKSSIPIDFEMPPTLLVVKKNGSVLKNVISYLKNNAKLSGGKIEIPILIIDDEVDQASVNTKSRSEIDESSAINKYIRKIMYLMRRYAYVGYTATPFANVFINAEIEDDEEKDIFPEDFIIGMPTPKYYSGIREFFGNINEDEEKDNKPDLVKDIDDEDELIKFIKEERTILPNSLVYALENFIISSAVKRSRGIKEHNTMLIHISSRKLPANRLKPLVEEQISNMYRLYKFDEETKVHYKSIWKNDIFIQSSSYLNEISTDKWDDIESEIKIVFELLKGEIKVLNSDSIDYIDYENTKQGQHIVIGGNKLSRGLTLEGLLTSYYFRKTNAYDTLLQMGRWFGYRKGWLDLCRIYTSRDLKIDFLQVADAIEAFKQNILEMNYQRLTPQDFQVKVKTLPQLAPTARSKMKNAIKIKLAYSNTLQQTITFDLREKNHNRSIVEELFSKISKFEIRKNKKLIAKNVRSNIITAFLDNYHESEEHSNRISIKYWLNYIKLANSIDELTDWTVVVSSKNRDEFPDKIGEFIIHKTRRSKRADSGDENIILTRAISDPADFKEFYSENSAEYKNIDRFSQSNDLIESTFTAKHGLLAIYDIDLYNKPLSGKQEWKSLVENGDGVIGLAIWFPKSKRENDIAVDYLVNKKFVMQQNSDNYKDDEDD